MSVFEGPLELLEYCSIISIQFLMNSSASLEPMSTCLTFYNEFDLVMLVDSLESDE